MLSINIKTFVLFSELSVMMASVILYIIVSLVAGGAVGALLMRLSQGRVAREKLRAELDLQAERNRSEELIADVQAGKKEIESLQEEVRIFLSEKSRLEAEGRALIEKYNEKNELCKQYAEEIVTLRHDVDEANAHRIRLEADYRALQEKLETQKAEIEKLHEQTLTQFKVMASNIMDEKSKAFKELNGESLKTILDPLNRDIENFKKQVTQCYETETRERTSLQEQIRQLTMQNEAMRREADKLSSALKGGSKVQGDWGEMILLNILQQSGLREGSDFEVQKAVEAQGDNSRPDAVLHFPNHGDMIIDSKVSFTAYDNYMNATTDEERKRYARQHLESVYGHIAELSRKDYPARNNRSPEFVIMFVPIESMFMLALDEARAQGKNLWHDAYMKRVIIMTPTNLVLAVRMLQDMWRQQRLEANIRAIKERAEKIYTQFISFAVDIDAVRANLDKAMTSCDSARRRLTSGNNNLIGQFEKMRHLGLEPKLPTGVSTMKTWTQLRDEAIGPDDIADMEGKNGEDVTALPAAES